MGEGRRPRKQTEAGKGITKQTAEKPDPAVGSLDRASGEGAVGGGSAEFQSVRPWAPGAQLQTAAGAWGCGGSALRQNWKQNREKRSHVGLCLHV